ncbi:DEAD/DEAH box helicase [Candidatus Pacearchaeota archaeon]|nr:DEAD/DEAH box helicase [Candidatus Pacearchaeota archaeon]
MEFLKGISPREYQKKIFKTCTEKNCLVVLPTGLGKTLIALMLAIERMKKHPGEKVVFLAPTKPLAEQHLQTFKKHLPELFGEMNLFTGTVKPKQRKKLWDKADIIFSTPQCVANDVKKYRYNLKNVCLLIEDEAHRCVKSYDYNYIADNYKSNALHPRILGLTASPGSNKTKIKNICRNLFIEEVELRTRDSPDVKPFLKKREFEKRPVDFPPEFEEMRQILHELFKKYVQELRNRKLLFGPSNKTKLIQLQKRLISKISRGKKDYNNLCGVSVCSQAIKLQHAMSLLETQTLESFNKYLKKLFKEAANKKSKGVVKLVSKPEFNKVFMKSNELLSKNKEHPKLNELKEIIIRENNENENLKIIVFTQFRDTASSISQEISKINGIESKVFVGQAKKKGSGSASGLSQKQQKKIINEFRGGQINVLCATCIAEEGLDIPEVNAVVFYEPIPSAIRTIQRAGRTARLEKGKLIILITKKTRDEAFYYVSKSRKKKMHNIINEVKEELANGKKFTKQKKLF